MMIVAVVVVMVRRRGNVSVLKFCYVDGCRYRRSHITAAHFCRHCRGFGHGARECGDDDAIAALRVEIKRQKDAKECITQTNRCKIPGCGRRWSHTSESHLCGRCFGRNHARNRCPNGHGGPMRMQSSSQQLSSSSSSSSSSLSSPSPSPPPPPSSSQEVDVPDCVMCRSKGGKYPKLVPIKGLTSDCCVCLESRTDFIKFPQCDHAICNICFSHLQEANNSGS